MDIHVTMFVYCQLISWHKFCDVLLLNIPFLELLTVSNEVDVWIVKSCCPLSMN